MLQQFYKQIASVTEPILYQDAWRYHPGPVLLLAGPGTGKTHQLALRLRDLVDVHGVDPESITVITFTKEAARNMRSRISDETRTDVYIPPDKRPRRVTTMHSLGQEIVRSYRDVLGLAEDFRVVAKDVLRRVLFTDAALLVGADEAAGLEADRTRRQGISADPGSRTEAVVNKYESILRKNMAIDYDDQIMLACHVLREDDSARGVYAATAQHLLVDEYQDINAAQRDLITLLSGQHPEGLFVVGDDDQSIYGFRGGSPQYIRAFGNEYEQGRVLSLNLSRRCTDKIVHSALQVVEAFDPARVSKPPPEFVTGKTNAARVEFHNVATEDQEAKAIAAIAQKAVRRQQDVLILIPARQYADRIKRELRRVNLSYDHPPSIDDTGIARVLDVYEWLESPTDNLALRLCLHFLCESGAVGVPTARVRSAAAREKRQAALTEIAGLWAKVIHGDKDLWSVLQEAASNKNGTVPSLHEKLKELYDLRKSGLEEFLAKIAKDFRPWSNQEAFTKELRSWREELLARSPAAEVRILTLQGAKGLEADVVCVVGFTEGILPRRDVTEEELAEAARLAYVSLTRAKEHLHLFHARKRDASTTYLENSFNLKASCLVGVIDKEHIQEQYHQAPSKKRKKPS
jgi:superfamily I DNA/RNA helicase